MSELFNTIENVKINGNPRALEEIVSKMDLCLQNIAADTDQICNIFFKMAGSVSGEQFKLAAVSTYNLAKFLSKQAEKMNIMQSEVVDYINKLLIFENQPGNATSNPFKITPLSIPTESSTISFTKNELIAIKNAIDTYNYDSRQRLIALNSEKNNIGSIWQDTQYMNFSKFIDDIISETVNQIKSLEDYSQELGEKIKSL